MITFFVDNKGGVRLDLSKIEKLNSTPWVVKLGKNEDGGLMLFKPNGEEIKTKGNKSWTNMIGNSGDRTELLETYADYFDANVSMKSAKFENSTPVHSPIPATFWIFGTSLVLLIIIRRKFHSSIS
jgi:hypothetical protein